MECLLLILTDKFPTLVKSEELPDYFTHGIYNFKKVNKWCGLFYDFFTFPCGDELYKIFQIEYSYVINSMGSFVKELLQQLDYIRIDDQRNVNDIGILDIRLRENPNKYKTQNSPFSQCFGDDYLFFDEKNNVLCFAFGQAENISC